MQSVNWLALRKERWNGIKDFSLKFLSIKNNAGKYKLYLGEFSLFRTVARIESPGIRIEYRSPSCLSPPCCQSVRLIEPGEES